MPMYEYSCSKCGNHMETIQKLSDPPLTKCPSCGGTIARLISPTAFVLKGGGWYKDGYSSATNAKPNKESQEATPKTCEQTGKPADSSCACANKTKSA